MPIIGFFSQLHFFLPFFRENTLMNDGL